VHIRFPGLVPIQPTLEASALLDPPYLPPASRGPNISSLSCAQSTAAEFPIPHPGSRFIEIIVIAGILGFPPIGIVHIVVIVREIRCGEAAQLVPSSPANPVCAYVAPNMTSSIPEAESGVHERALPDANVHRRSARRYYDAQRFRRTGERAQSPHDDRSSESPGGRGRTHKTPHSPWNRRRRGSSSW